MRKLHRSTVWGLLWLAFSAASFATTLTITGHPEVVPVDGGGGEFTAYLDNNSNATFNVFCVDYRNSITGIPDTFNVNVSTLSNLSNTRYGLLSDSAFSFYKGASGDPDAGSGANRYLLAAWLTTQYNFSSGVTAADNAIQDAIWNLLDVNGVHNNLDSTDAAVKQMVQNAVNWENSQSMSSLMSFANTVKIYTDVKVANYYANYCESRYQCGQQEYISSTPEPSQLLLMGSGLVALGFLRRKK